MPLGNLPENLEKVADAGGWDARAMEQAKEFMKDVSKIKPNQWKGINENLKIVKDLVDVNMEGFATQMIDNITTNVKLEVEAALAPITNEINTAIANILEPFLQEFIMPIITDIGTFFAENAVGTGVGGIAGGVIGAFLGNPAIGAMIGASVGAALQEYFKWVDTVYPDQSGSGSPIGFAQWREENKNGIFYPTFADYLAWLKTQSRPHGYFQDPDDYSGGR